MLKEEAEEGEEVGMGWRWEEGEGERGERKEEDEGERGTAAVAHPLVIAPTLWGPPVVMKHTHTHNM